MRMWIKRIWQTSPPVMRLPKRQSSNRSQHRCRLESLEGRWMMAATIVESPLASSDDGSRSVFTRIISPQTPATSTAGQYPSVGLVGDTSGSFCSGTLISPTFVLTAAHCAVGVADNAGRFIVGGQTYGTSDVIVHPSYNESRLGTDSANDIALYRLNRSVTNVTPSPIYRSAPRVGETLTLVGFGGGRSSTGGSDGSFGTKRAGDTPIDRVSRTIVGWTYDNLSESNTAPGDSGGPAFLRVNGVSYIAGVTSGGSSEDAGLGDQSFDTRVDAYAAWIDSMVGSTTTVVLPTVSIVGTDINAAERLSTQTADGGVYTISRTGSTASPLTVQFTVSGTATNGVDYSTLSNTRTIPAGVSSITVALNVINDSISEASETATLTLATSSAYEINTSSRTATVSIADNDTPVALGNDRFANRQLLTGTNTTATGSTTTATRETGEPNAAGVSGGKSIWYTWTAANNGLVSLSTAGSNFDTTLGVYTGTALSALTQVAANDDENFAAGRYTSRVTFNAVAGRTYQILVDGYAGASGAVNLALSQTVTSRSTATATSAPSNSRTTPFWANPYVAHNQSVAPVNQVPVASNAIRDAIFATLRTRR
jgi:hypothetical protein